MRYVKYTITDRNGKLISMGQLEWRNVEKKKQFARRSDEALMAGYLVSTEAMADMEAITGRVGAAPHDIVPYTMRAALDEVANEFSKGLADLKEYLGEAIGHAVSAAAQPMPVYGKSFVAQVMQDAAEISDTLKAAQERGEDITDLRQLYPPPARPFDEGTKANEEKRRKDREYRRNKRAGERAKAATKVATTTD